MMGFAALYAILQMRPCAKIKQYGLRVLSDDAGYFPRYGAVQLYRLDVEWRAVRALEGRISEAGMIEMNAAAEAGRCDTGSVAGADDAIPV
jgi:osmoprotectant transport system permease protein